MWLAPREIKDNGLETNNKAFVFYLPFIFLYLPLISFLHSMFLLPVGLYHGAAEVTMNDNPPSLQMP